MFKKLAREVVCRLLEHQVKRLRSQYGFTVVAVGGSVGKTSTKLAVAELLNTQRRVLYQTGNYNDRTTVPLVFFGRSQPSLLNPVAWLRVLIANARMYRHDFPYDVVVVELGTDHPGSMAQFSYLKPDVAVLTAVTPEHMEFFGTLDAVAAEELELLNYSAVTLVNIDDTPSHYLTGKRFTSYSTLSSRTDYYAASETSSLSGQTIHLQALDMSLKARLQYAGTQGLKVALAAAAAAHMLGFSEQQIKDGLPQLKPYAGRMQLLEGIEGSSLIDDTYNATPVAVKAALDVVYTQPSAGQRIAILGSMNELGAYSEDAHREVGEYCDPGKLDMVVTIGKMARDWIAPPAKQKGCSVHAYLSPYEAGDFVRSQLKAGAIVLAKGSQNGVFAEEALKKLLRNPTDAKKLVRQNDEWLAVKRRQFPQPS